MTELDKFLAKKEKKKIKGKLFDDPDEIARRLVESEKKLEKEFIKDKPTCNEFTKKPVKVKGGEIMKTLKESSFLLIANIPQCLHSKDLRNYFYYYIQKNAFSCFNYRHRPEETIFNSLKKARDLFSFQGIPKESTLQNSCDGSVSKNLQTTIQMCEEKFKTNINLTYNSDIKNGIQEIDKFLTKTEKETDEPLNISSNKSLKDNKDENSNKSTLTHGQQSSNINPGRCCSIILIKNEFLYSFKNDFNKRFWVKFDGTVLPIRCLIFDVSGIFKLYQSLSDDTVRDTPNLPYKTKAEQKIERKKFSFKEITKLLEVTPAKMMPQGNVGTTEEYFKSLVKQCKLPSSVIERLGLACSVTRKKRKYGQVHLDYEMEANGNPSETLFTQNGDWIPGYYDIKFNKLLQNSSGPILDEEDEEEEDGAEIEEWERFEAFHDDVTKQERIKERLFEEDMEVVWEKGGSGLVFYTDSQFWRIYEGEEEERNVDEWDVDVTPHYQKGGGDFDARAAAEMKEISALRDGRANSSVFAAGMRIAPKDRSKKKKKKTTEAESKQKIATKKHPRSKKSKSKENEKIGEFEMFSKGIGRRLLEAQGWKDGDGLGKDKKGIAHALDNAGQGPCDRSGFGYSKKQGKDSKKKNSVGEKTRISAKKECPTFSSPSPVICLNPSSKEAFVYKKWFTKSSD